MKKLKLVICCLIFLAASISAANAQQTFKTTRPSVIAYYEYLPADYNWNSNKYPVVIFLHGIGERGPNTTNVQTLAGSIPKVAVNGPPKLVKYGTKFPFILISPQLKSNYGLWTSAYVMEVINHVKTYLRIDEKRIYLTGLSLGGGGAWTTAQDFAGTFAALAPVCGGYNTPSRASNIAKESLPVWGFHGDKDNIVAMAKTTTMIAAINGCKPVINPLAKLTIYPGVYHNAWDNAYKNDHTVHNPNVYEWMTSKTKTVRAGNRIPTANANADQTKSRAKGTSVTIWGTGADADGTITSYTWTKIGGPACTLANANTRALTVNGLLVGTYMFRLTVKDNSGNTDSDYVKVTVTN